jgi:hypothetical protein
MLGLGLQATLTNEGGGIAKKQPVKDGLVMYHQYQDFPTDSLRLSFPAEGSAEFNGTSDYIEVLNDGKGSAFDTQEFTIGAWVNAKTLGDNVIWSYDFTSQVSPYYAQQLRITSSNAVLFSWNNGSSLVAIVTNPNEVSSNQWYYISATYKNGEQKLYKDGSVIGSSILNQTITYYNQQVLIGKSPNFSAEFDGNMANVAFWNRVLTSDEINTAMWASYDQLPTSIKVGLQAWYALDNITGTDVPDSTGNYNGTAY